MALSGKQKLSIGALLGYLVAWAFDPFITIFRLNVENWATEKHFHNLYAKVPWAFLWGWLMSLLSWSGELYEFLSGSFGLGFVIAAVLFAFLDPIARYSRARWYSGGQLGFYGWGWDGFARITRDGGSYDVILLELHNAEYGGNAEDVRVTLTEIEDVKGNVEKPNRRLSCRATGATRFSIAPNTHRKIIVLESHRRDDLAIPVKNPRLLFGPLAGC
jgi:hypothetical protein